MNEGEVGIPYFDELLKLVDADEDTRRAFGKDVHWGYWEDPATADGTIDSFAAASENLTRKTVSEAPLRDGIRILDVGCGFGGTIQTINEMVSGCELIGINIDERQLARARSQVTPKNGNTIEFQQMDANELEVEGQFDVMFAVECIFHFDRPLFFQHVQRFLQPEGRFVITDFIVKPWKLPIFKMLDGLCRGATLGTYGDIDLSYSVDRYRKVAGAAGLLCGQDLDITANTLPTYEFVLQQIAKVPDRQRSKTFRKATRGLDLATRWGIIGYHILSFSHRESSSQSGE